MILTLVDDVNNQLLDKLMLEKDINKYTQLLNEFNNSYKH